MKECFLDYSSDGKTRRSYRQSGDSGVVAVAVVVVVAAVAAATWTSNWRQKDERRWTAGSSDSSRKRVSFSLVLFLLILPHRSRDLGSFFFLRNESGKCKRF